MCVRTFYRFGLYGEEDTDMHLAKHIYSNFCEFLSRWRDRSLSFRESHVL
jgi:hypothetical protein